jgi:serine/threonine protein phosphatase PrpC
MNVRAIRSSPTALLVDLAREYPGVGVDDRHAGMATMRGRIPQANQDFCAAFSVDAPCGERYLVAAVADGIGSTRCAEVASFVAVSGAARGVVRYVLDHGDGGDARRAVEAGFAAAIDEVAAAAAASEECQDMGTTLILVVSTASHTAWVHVGDGLGVAVSESARVRTWLAPQRSGDGALTSAIGRTLLGEPRTGVLRPGGTVLIASDGIADFVEHESLLSEVERIRAMRPEDLGAVCTELLAQMAEAWNDGDFACQDNLSIALICQEGSP